MRGDAYLYVLDRRACSPASCLPAALAGCLVPLPAPRPVESAATVPPSCGERPRDGGHA